MSKKLLMVGLVIVFAFGTLFAVACGGDDEAGKQTMRDALTVIEADITGLTATFSTGEVTSADLKAVLAANQPDWQAVIDACADVKDADAVMAQQVWDDVQTAIDGLADDADLAEIGAAVMVPVQAMQAYVQELRALVGGDAATTE